jgi:multidrug efflux pump subunit AcrA (membrane-fusion protein)
MKGGITKRKAGIFSLALLGILLFFSKTVYYHGLPEVSAVKPFRGILNKFETSSGSADWTEVDTIYAQVGGTVGKVFVKEGETVEAGQILFTLDFDIDAAERKLREIRNNIEKLENDIRHSSAKLAVLARALDEAGDGSTGGGGDDSDDSDNDDDADRDTGDTGEHRPDLISLDLHKARLALRAAELSYELGTLSRSNLDAARDNVLALYLKYETEKEDLELAIRSKAIDLRNLRLQEESCRNTLRDYRAYAAISAAAEGVVVSLNVSRGMYVQEKAPMVSIGVGNEFTVTCTVSPENNFILPGDSCELSNSSLSITGLVSQVKPSAQGKRVSIGIVSGEVKAGESFDIIFEKDSAAAYTLVPSAALNQDNDGYFLNRIKRRRGILGEEYYAERLDVYIGDSDHTNTIIIKGLSFFEPLILRSDKPVHAGDMVSLANPEDFFEN